MHSLAQDNVLRLRDTNFAYVTVLCVYVGQPLVVATSGNHPLLNGVIVLVD